jgi:hypothetical protein
MLGDNVNFVNAPAVASRPTDTGKLFVLAQTERGTTTEAIVAKSMPELLAKCGGKISQSVLRDAAEAAFQEGVSTMLFGRVVGATPVAASVELETAGKTKSIKVAAKNVGEWGNSLKVQVKAGETEGFYRLVITENGVPVEETPDLLSQAAAATWSETSTYVTVTVLGGSGNPAVVAATELTGGTQDFTHVTTASWEAALALFPKDLGCGQIVAFGNTSSGVQIALEKHGEENNRTPLPDLPNIKAGETLAEYEAKLITAASPLRTVTGARRSAAYGPWAIIPGLAPGTTRVVPYSAIQAGMLALKDATAEPPPINEPSAGENGQPRYATGLTAVFSRAQIEALTEGGVNAARVLPGGQIETYGNRTLVKPETEPAWEEVSAARLYMFVASRGEEILASFKWKQIDRARLLFNRVAKELQGFLGSLGSMLDNDVTEAVDTGPGVNTDVTIKEKRIIADLTVQPAGIAESTTLNISAQGV